MRKRKKQIGVLITLEAYISGRRQLVTCTRSIGYRPWVRIEDPESAKVAFCRALVQAAMDLPPLMVEGEDNEIAVYQRTRKKGAQNG